MMGKEGNWRDEWAEARSTRVCGKMMGLREIGFNRQLVREGGEKREGFGKRAWRGKEGGGD